VSSSLLGKLVVLAVVITLVTIALSRGFQAAALPMDEGMLLVGPELLLKGQLPYRDFHLTKGPGNLAVLSAGFAAFGPHIFVERAVGLAYRLAILLSIFGIAQRWGTIVAAGCMLTGGMLLAATDLMAHTWIAAMAFALCSLWMMANIDSKWRCFGAGALAALAFSCRLDLGAAFILSVLPLFLAMPYPGKKMFFAGIGIALFPFVGLIIAIGAQRIFESLVAFPIFHLGPGRYLSIASANAEVIRISFWHLLAGVVNLAAAIASPRTESNQPQRRLLLSVAIFGFLLVHYALLRFDSIHALLAGLLSISFLPVSIFVLLSHKRLHLPAMARAVAAVAIVILGLQLTFPLIAHYFYRNLQAELGIGPVRQASKAGETAEPRDRGVFIERNGRAFPFGTAPAANAAVDAIAELEKVTVPGQRLFVGPRDLSQTQYCDTYVYHLLPQLRPATYFLEMSPAIGKNQSARLASDIESADWLLLNRTWDYMSDANVASRYGHDRATAAVKENFELWSERGPYLLFRHRKHRNFVVPPPPGS
jgi:hypothetical protein